MVCNIQYTDESKSVFYNWWCRGYSNLNKDVQKE